MARKELKTSIQIQSTPEKVWKILTDFENYPNWNPFIKSIQGNVTPGSYINIQAGNMRFKPKVLAFNPNKELCWLGKLWFTGLFDGEHAFIIQDNQDGSITFRHEEKFKGILVGLFRKKLDTEIKEAFEQMNQKLKELAENEHFYSKSH